MSLREGKYLRFSKEALDMIQEIGDDLRKIMEKYSDRFTPDEIAYAIVSSAIDAECYFVLGRASKIVREEK